MSTVKQGERGVSLPEQKDAIIQYAQRYGFDIARWFIETESAASTGRPVFNEMLELLRSGKASGVVIHKIDRSMRNLEDWTDVGKLVDTGVDVHFATENVDLKTVAGRLAADIQAVFAAHYSRNLREEAKKGYYGRLKQGIAPFQAPIGYLDEGAGKPKSIDPVRGPLVRAAFERYAMGNVSIRQLKKELADSGLRTKNDRHISVNALNRMLSNSFYIGIIHVRKADQSFAAAHEPLISNAVFERVQAIMSGRAVRGGLRHVFTFSRLIHCASCGRHLIAETHKGHVYYRCHSQQCGGSCLREEKVLGFVASEMGKIELSDAEVRVLDDVVAHYRTMLLSGAQDQARGLALSVETITGRLSRLTDAFIDGAIDQELFSQKKTALVEERQRLQERIQMLSRSPQVSTAEMDKFVELVKTAYLSYGNGNPTEIRGILHHVMSNLSVNKKNLTFSWNFPFSEIASRSCVPSGGPHRDNPRTFWERLFQVILSSETFQKHVPRPASVA